MREVIIDLDEVKLEIELTRIRLREDLEYIEFEVGKKTDFSRQCLLYDFFGYARFHCEKVTKEDGAVIFKINPAENLLDRDQASTRKRLDQIASILKSFSREFFCYFPVESLYDQFKTLSKSEDGLWTKIFDHFSGQIINCQQLHEVIPYSNHDNQDTRIELDEEIIQPANINEKDAQGNTFLQKLITTKKLEQAVELLKTHQDIDINNLNKDDKSALELCAENGCSELAVMLIKKGAEIRNCFFSTIPEKLAFQNKHYETESRITMALIERHQEQYERQQEQGLEEYIKLTELCSTYKLKK